MAKATIKASFIRANRRTYSKAQLERFFVDQRRAWNVVKSTTLADFLSFVTTAQIVKEATFRCEAYKQEITRYVFGNASPVELAVSLKPRGYLSHGTAANLHGLAKSKLQTFYINVEQSPKRPSESPLSQDGIDRAFARRQRQSNLIYAYNDMSVTILSGKHTQHLGVEDLAVAGVASVPVTNIERTLIDIAVRPAYAGGPSQLLQIYRAAKHRISVDGLLTVLRKLDHVYPYHQTIGFLMQRAGYAPKAYEKLRALGLSHDFYLAHEITDLDYSKEWRLHFPSSLGT